MKAYLRDDNRSRRILFFLIFLAILCLAPILYLGRYDVPSSDDFSYSVWTHAAFRESGKVPAVLKAAADQTAESYHSWQGTFSAIFLFALQPALFRFQAYAVTPWIILAGLLTGMIVFCATLFHSVFGERRTFGASVALGIILVFIETLPSPVEGFYWYNGAIYYLFFFSLSLISFALVIRLQQTQSVLLLILLCLLNVVLGGSNYVTALCCILVDVSVLILLLMMNKRKAAGSMILPAVFVLGALLFSALAPGNQVRQEQLEYQPQAIASIIASFKTAAKLSAQWVRLPVIGWVLLLTVFTWGEKKKEPRSFRYPGLVSLWSYCILSAMCCPPLYAMGNIGALRLVNMLYCTYIVLLTGNLYYWLGWLKARTDGSVMPGKLLCVIMTGLAILCFGVHLFIGHGYTSLMAVGELRSGEAEEYYAAAAERVAVLENPEITDVELEPFPCTPYLLFMEDISESMDFYGNQDMCSYYGKNSIILKAASD